MMRRERSVAFALDDEDEQGDGFDDDPLADDDEGWGEVRYGPSPDTRRVRERALARRRMHGNAVSAPSNIKRKLAASPDLTSHKRRRSNMRELDESLLSFEQALNSTPAPRAEPRLLQRVNAAPDVDLQLDDDSSGDVRMDGADSSSEEVQPDFVSELQKARRSHKSPFATRGRFKASSSVFTTPSPVAPPRSLHAPKKKQIKLSSLPFSKRMRNNIAKRSPGTGLKRLKTAPHTPRATSSSTPRTAPFSARFRRQLERKERRKRKKNARRKRRRAASDDLFSSSSSSSSSAPSSPRRTKTIIDEIEDASDAEPVPRRRGRLVESIDDSSSDAAPPPRRQRARLDEIEEEEQLSDEQPPAQLNLLDEIEDVRSVTPSLEMQGDFDPPEDQGDQAALKSRNSWLSAAARRVDESAVLPASTPVKDGFIDVTSPTKRRYGRRKQIRRTGLCAVLGKALRRKKAAASVFLHKRAKLAPGKRPQAPSLLLRVDRVVAAPAKSVVVECSVVPEELAKLHPTVRALVSELVDRAPSVSPPRVSVLLLTSVFTSNLGGMRRCGPGAFFTAFGPWKVFPPVHSTESVLLSNVFAVKPFDTASGQAQLAQVSHILAPLAEAAARRTAEIQASAPVGSLEPSLGSPTEPSVAAEPHDGPVLLHNPAPSIASLQSAIVHSTSATATNRPMVSLTGRVRGVRVRGEVMGALGDSTVDVVVSSRDVASSFFLFDTDTGHACRVRVPPGALLERWLPWLLRISGTDPGDEPPCASVVSLDGLVVCGFEAVDGAMAKYLQELAAPQQWAPVGGVPVLSLTGSSCLAGEEAEEHADEQAPSPQLTCFGRVPHLRAGTRVSVLGAVLSVHVVSTAELYDVVSATTPLTPCEPSQESSAQDSQDSQAGGVEASPSPREPRALSSMPFVSPLTRSTTALVYLTASSSPESLDAPDVVCVACPLPQHANILRQFAPFPVGLIVQDALVQDDDMRFLVADRFSELLVPRVTAESMIGASQMQAGAFQSCEKTWIRRCAVSPPEMMATLQGLEPGCSDAMKLRVFNPLTPSSAAGIIAGCIEFDRLPHLGLRSRLECGLCGGVYDCGESDAAPALCPFCEQMDVPPRKHVEVVMLVNGVQCVAGLSALSLILDAHQEEQQVLQSTAGHSSEEFVFRALDGRKIEALATRSPFQQQQLRLVMAVLA